jgi:glycerophosphoryl diester phosphodiesterase
MAGLPQPLIYAHRGASFDHPEMSRAAYVAAVRQGADGFECDLRLTKDDLLVCWHDPSLKRVAGIDLSVADFTFAELNAAYPLLTLEELLGIALEYRKGLALETKHPVPTGGAVERKLLEVLKCYQPQILEAGIQISIMSFSWLAIRRVRKAPWNSVYLVAHRWLYYFNIGLSIGPSVDFLSKMHRANSGKKKLFVWTANTAEEILLCHEKGVDVMMTDRPAFARTILESV